MSRWEKKKLAQVSRIIMGQSPSGETYNSDGVGLPFYQGKAEFGIYSPIPVKWCASPLKIAEKGDILLSVRAPVGPTNIAPHRCCIGRGLSAIRGNENDCRNVFLRYYFKKFESEIANKGVGSTFDAIGKQDIENLEIPLPPLAEQERIVSILDEAEEMKRLRAKTNNRTADLIPALFDEMFGDLGSSSKKWNVCKLGEICMINPRSIGKELMDEDKVSFIPMSEVEQNKGRVLSTLNARFGDVKRGYTQFIDGDIIFAKITPCMENGKAALVNNLFNGVGFGSTEFHVLRPKKQIDAIFLLSLIQRESFRQQAKASFTGTAGQKRVPVDFLINYPLALPPLALQKEFAARVEEIYVLSVDQSAAEKKLESLFQSLLHRAFEGEL